MSGAEPARQRQINVGSIRQKRDGPPSRNRYGHLPLEKVERDFHVWKINRDVGETEKTSECVQAQLTPKPRQNCCANEKEPGASIAGTLGNKMNQTVYEVYGIPNYTQFMKCL